MKCHKCNGSGEQFAAVIVNGEASNLEYLLGQFNDPLGFALTMFVGVRTGKWVREAKIINYNGNEFTLRPEVPWATDPHVSFNRTRYQPPSTSQMMSSLQSLMSAITWLTKSGVLITSSSMLAFPTTTMLCNQANPLVNSFIDPLERLPLARTEKGAKCLAFYREALTINRIPYEYLSYCRIMNLLLGEGLQNKLSKIARDITEPNAVSRRTDILNAKAKTGKDVGEVIYTDGRNSVAHTELNPDDCSELWNLHLNMPLARTLAERLIETKGEIELVCV